MAWQTWNTWIHIKVNTPGLFPTIPCPACGPSFLVATHDPSVQSGDQLYSTSHFSFELPWLSFFLHPSTQAFMPAKPLASWEHLQTCEPWSKILSLNLLAFLFRAPFHFTLNGTAKHISPRHPILSCEKHWKVTKEPLIGLSTLSSIYNLESISPTLWSNLWAWKNKHKTKQPGCFGHCPCWLCRSKSFWMPFAKWSVCIAKCSLPMYFSNCSDPNSTPKKSLGSRGGINLRCPHGPSQNKKVFLFLLKGNHKEFGGIPVFETPFLLLKLKFKTSQKRPKSETRRNPASRLGMAWSLMASTSWPLDRK